MKTVKTEKMQLFEEPQIKLLQRGSKMLSDVEILSVLLTGGKTTKGLEIASNVLEAVNGNLTELSRFSSHRLEKISGMTAMKAAILIAAFELCRRRREQEHSVVKITSSMSAFQMMCPIIGELSHEEFWVVFLNNSNKVLGKEMIGKGGITGTVVDIRILFKLAIEREATAIILFHNHPSGILTPSDADRTITRKIGQAGKNLDIRLLDHIIVTDKNYYSFADNGVLN